MRLAIFVGAVLVSTALVLVGLLGGGELVARPWGIVFEDELDEEDRGLAHPSRRLEPSGATTELHRDPDGEERWREVDYEALSRDELDRCLDSGHGADIALLLFEHCSSDITDDWLPTAENFVAFVDLRLTQVATLEFSYVRELLEREHVEHGYDLSGEGLLVARLGGLPSSDDTWRLWEREGTRAAFERALFYWHVASEAEMRAPRHGSTDVFSQLVHVEQNQERLAQIAWFSIFTPLDHYPHWEILMRVAQAHFQ